jgi:hypothetical protein
MEGDLERVFTSLLPSLTLADNTHTHTYVKYTTCLENLKKSEYSVKKYFFLSKKIARKFLVSFVKQKGVLLMCSFDPAAGCVKSELSNALDKSLYFVVFFCPTPHMYLIRRIVRVRLTVNKVTM